MIGIGLRHSHYNEVLETSPSISWFEVHSENFFEGGLPIQKLLEIRKNYPISLHGVGLSLGTASGIDKQHLESLKKLIETINPCFISEHLSWSRISNAYLPDLLPIPYTEESLAVFIRNIEQTQDYLKREIFIENPSSYIEYRYSVYEEVDFLVELMQRTGAKMLLDVNNVFVSSSNHGWNAEQYIEKIPLNYVREIHIAGHSIRHIGENKDFILRVDTHDNAVSPEVWNLYHLAIERFGPMPTLLEWDANIPSLSSLIAEASKAFAYLQSAAYEKLGTDTATIC